LGVDLIPVQPPKGVSTIQGDFLSPDVQAEIKSFLRDPERGRLRRPLMFGMPETTPSDDGHIDQGLLEDAESGGYLERESHIAVEEAEQQQHQEKNMASEQTQEHEHQDKCIDVVLSDMWEPWDPLDGLYKKSISNPYYRLMNTSGVAFRDHAGSMVSFRISCFLSTSVLELTVCARISAELPCNLATTL
jgi:21S rRNA (uridine2791-2'-O)-methyltransferase